MKTIYYPGWGVVWKIYSRENLKKSIWLPLVLTVVSFASTILSVGPNMLGFTLSGYALMMGLSNSEFVRGLINFKEEGKDYSLFQSLNTIFAVVLGMMFLTTIVGAFACIVVKAEISLPEAWSSFINAYNWVCLFVLMFLMYYTINAIKDVVINIFNFGQYVQVYAEKTEDDEINEKGFE